MHTFRIINTEFFAPWWPFSFLTHTTRHQSSLKLSWNVDSPSRFGPHNMCPKFPGGLSVRSWLSTPLPPCLMHFSFDFWMQRWIVLIENIFLKYSWTPAVIMIMVVRWLLIKHRVWSSRPSNMGYLPWQISPDFGNLFTILCRVDIERPKFFAILHWEIFSLSWLTIV